jgi:basic membrane protein A
MGLLLAGMAIGLLGGCGDGSSSDGGGPTVALVYDVGGVGDKSFNDSAHRGLERAHDSLGVEFEHLEPPSGADREASLRALAAGPARLVFGVGFLFSDDIRAMAEEFPAKHFVCVDYSLREGEVLPENLRAIRFREEEGSFLVGALAALTSGTGKIGFVGGMDIPLIHRFEAGYVAGARHVREDIEVFVSYAGVTGEAFANPAKGKELATAQYDSGADIIFHAAGATGLGVFEAARRARRFAIGVDSDQHDEAPDRVLTSMVKHVDVAVFRTVQAELEGTFTSGVVELGLAEGGVGYVYDERNADRIPDEVRDEVEEIRRAIIAGDIEVPRTR